MQARLGSARSPRKQPNSPEGHELAAACARMVKFRAENERECLLRNAFRARKTPKRLAAYAMVFSI